MRKLAEPVRGWHIEFLHDWKAPGQTTLEFRILREGSLDGFLGYFKSVLCPGVSLPNSPRLGPTHRPQFYFPVLDQPQVKPGQLLHLDIDPRGVAGEAQWEYRIALHSFPESGAALASTAN